MQVEVRVVLLHKGRLIVHPEHAHDGDHYSLPGGQVAARETAEAAVEREVREELGIDVVVKQLLYVFEVVSRIELHNLELVFLAEPKDAASELRLAQLETVDLHAEARVLPPIVGEIAADLAGAWQGNPRWLGNVWRSARESAVGSGVGTQTPGDADEQGDRRELRSY